MAKKQQPETGKVKARVLLDCQFGKVDQVVEVDAEEAKQHADKLDTHPDAVAYAESLKD